MKYYKLIKREITEDEYEKYKKKFKEITIRCYNNEEIVETFEHPFFLTKAIKKDEK